MTGMIRVFRLDYLLSVEDILVEGISVKHRVIKVQFGNIICLSQEGTNSFCDYPSIFLNWLLLINLYQIIRNTLG